MSRSDALQSEEISPTLAGPKSGSEAGRASAGVARRRGRVHPPGLFQAARSRVPPSHPGGGGYCPLGATTGFFSRPMPVTSTAMTSPVLTNRGGLRNPLQPEGVPVKMIPGWSVKYLLRYSISSGTVNNMSDLSSSPPAPRPCWSGQCPGTPARTRTRWKHPSKSSARGVKDPSRFLPHRWPIPGSRSKETTTLD